METRFKDTTIGRIPEEWDLCQINDVAVVNAGQSPSSFDCNVEGKGIPFFQGNADFGYKYPRISSWTTNPTKIARRNDILMSVRAPVGEINFADTECCIGRGLCAITPKSRVTLNFLYYMLISSMPRLLRFQQGSTFLAVNRGNIDMHFIPLPPLPEQRKIAEILSTVDEAIEKTDAIIQETQQLKKGLMRKLFTEGVGHTRFKETKIGRIPEEWELKPLGSLGDFFKGTSIAASEIVENGLPCIRYGDIYVQYESDNVVTHFSAFISRDTAEHSRRIYEGDILFAGTGETQEDIGKCVAYTITEEAYAGGDLIVFRPQIERQLNSVFLSYCMSCGEVLKAKSRIGQGLSIFHIYSKNLKTLCVPLPSVSEQNKIAGIISGFDIKIKAEQTYKSELGQLKKGLMQVLLTGKVRVKV